MKKNGTVSQALTRMHDSFATFASASHGTVVPKSGWMTLLLTTPNWSRSPCQASSERKPGTAHGMIRIARYVRRKRIPFLSSVIARKSPIANDKKTVPAAKTNVHANTLRKGVRMSGSWMMREKFLVPTPVFQPGSSASVPRANSPLPSSRKTAPSASRTKTPRFAS